MSKVVQLESHDDINLQACEWVAKLDRTLSQEESEALQRWMASSERHRQQLFALAAMWDRMDSLSCLADIFPEHRGATTRALANPRQKTVSLWWRNTSVAACFILLVLGCSWLIKHASPNDLPPSIAAWLGAEQIEITEFETSIGEHSTVMLSDGSELILNTNTLATVHYSKQARVVYLRRGEIHIDVAHNPLRPLSVVAGKNIVQAVGTAFNVQLTKTSELELIVTEGRVRVARELESTPLRRNQPPLLNAASLSLTEGEKIVLGDKGSDVIKLDDGDMNASLSWRQGNIVFRGETLEVALSEISRYTGVEFTIADEGIKNTRIAGMFKAGDVNGLLIALRQNFNISSNKYADNKVQLKSL